MANETTISPTTEAKDIPYGIVLVWCIAGVLVIILVIVAIYYSYAICCQKKSRGKHQRPYPQQNPPKYLIEDYPKGFIDYLHNGNINSRAMFSPTFVDHMRIPRAMEVKIIDTVNSLNESHSQPSYSPPSHTPTRSMNELLNPDMFSFPNERITPALPERERMTPSRQQSFRYSNMSVEESKERIYKEKMLVSELREKLRNQRKLDQRD